MEGGEGSKGGILDVIHGIPKIDDIQLLRSVEQSIQGYQTRPTVENGCSDLKNNKIPTYQV